MSILQISLFGHVRISLDDWITQEKLTRVNQRLLAFLLLNRNRTFPRDVLTGLFWGEHSQEKARGSLSTALWQLRRILEPKGILKGTYLTNTQLGEVGFNLESEYWLDVAVFEDQIKCLLEYPIQSVDERHVGELKNILQLHKEELLEGFYEDWALRERERLRLLYLKGLINLLTYDEEKGFYENGLLCGQQILDLDPLREEIHRAMMRLYLKTGQRAQAARQYEICKAILTKELNIQPMDETYELYEQVISEASNGRRFIFNIERTNLERAIEQLRSATQTYELAREQAQKALQLIEKSIERRD